MSLTPTRRAAPLMAAALGLSALGLGACGFTPLYGDASLTEGLSQVAVEVPSHSRTGYLIRQAMDDELGRDRTAAPRYRVRLDLRESRGPRGVRVNNVAGRYEITLTTTYYLEDAASGRPLTSGAFVTQVSYDSADAPYGGLAASQDGEERTAAQAALRLRMELSNYIKGHPYGAAVTVAGKQSRYQSKAGAPTLGTGDGATDEPPRDDRGQEPGGPDAQPRKGDTPAPPETPRAPL